jgi:cysteine desulfurase
MPYDPRTINLDNNATTQPSPGVVAGVARALERTWHNPSSVHRAGQAARNEVELARASLATLIGAKPRDCVLTSSGTEALDLAIRGFLAARGARPHRVVSTRVEHACVRDFCEDLARTGTTIAHLPPDPQGVIDLARAPEVLTPDTDLCVVQWANNETGAIQPVAQLGAMCRAQRVAFCVDAVQWVGKEPTDIARDGPFDLLAFSPHKLHGPKGVGVLWVRPGVRVSPRILGTQELGRRGGTENVPGIVGAGIAAEESRAWLEDASSRARIGALRDLLEREVLAAIPEARVNGPTAPSSRLWNTTNIGFPRLEAEALLLLLSEKGVCASAGAACSSGSLEPSPVLLAMGVPAEWAHGSVRFSLSRHTTEQEVRDAVAIIIGAVRALRVSLPA